MKTRFLLILVLLLISAQLVSAQEDFEEPTGTIGYNETVEGSFDDEARQLWQFSGFSGDFVTITMIAEEDSPLDPLLELYFDGELITENDDSGDSAIGILNAQIDAYQLQESGDYLIAARCFLPSCDGNYTLSLSVEQAMMAEEDAEEASEDGDMQQVDFERPGSPDLAFSIMIPSGWEFEATGGRYLVGDTFENLSEADDSPIPDGGIQIEFLLAYDEPDFQDMVSLEEILNVFVDFLNSDSTPEPYEGLEVPAAILNPVGGDAPEDALLIAFESEAGLVLVAVRTSDFESQQDAVNAIIDSFTPYTDDMQSMGGEAAGGSGMQRVGFEQPGSPDLAFTIMIPSGWEAERFDGRYLVGDTFDNLSQADDIPIPDGGVQIEFLLVYNESDFRELASTPEEILSVFVTFLLESDSTPEPYEGLEVPAAILNPAGGSAPEDALLIAFESEAGLVIVAVRTSDFESQQDTVNAIIDSFTPYED